MLPQDATIIIDKYYPTEEDDSLANMYRAYADFEDEGDANAFGDWIQMNLPEGTISLVPMGPNFEPSLVGYTILLWVAGVHLVRVYFIPGLGSPIIIP